MGLKAILIHGFRIRPVLDEKTRELVVFHVECDVKRGVASSVGSIQTRSGLNQHPQPLAVVAPRRDVNQAIPVAIDEFQGDSALIQQGL